MGVFPAASGNFLPESWRDLMKNEVCQGERRRGKVGGEKGEGRWERRRERGGGRGGGKG